MRPALDYAATGKPRITRGHAWGILVRTLGYTVTALLCSALVQHVDHAWAFAIRIGLVIGIVTGIGGAIVPVLGGLVGCEVDVKKQIIRCKNGAAKGEVHCAPVRHA